MCVNNYDRPKITTNPRARQHFPSIHRIPSNTSTSGLTRTFPLPFIMIFINIIATSMCGLVGPLCVFVNCNFRFYLSKRIIHPGYFKPHIYIQSYFSYDLLQNRNTYYFLHTKKQRETYKLEAMAQDKGYPPLSRTVEVQIDVVDRANNPPVWDHVVYGPIYVKENMPVGGKVVSIKARSVQAYIFHNQNHNPHRLFHRFFSYHHIVHLKLRLSIHFHFTLSTICGIISFEGKLISII